MCLERYGADFWINCPVLAVDAVVWTFRRTFAKKSGENTSFSRSKVEIEKCSLNLSRKTIQ